MSNNGQKMAERKNKLKSPGKMGMGKWENGKRTLILAYCQFNIKAEGLTTLFCCLRVSLAFSSEACECFPVSR